MMRKFFANTEGSISDLHNTSLVPAFLTSRHMSFDDISSKEMNSISSQ